MRNLKIAAAVAGVIAAGAATTSFAAATSQAAANAATLKFHMGGSSAAIGGLATSVGADLCGGAANLTLFTSNPSGSSAGTPDFRAISCIAAKPAAFAGQQITVYYRAEAGSVVGVYAPYNGVAVNELDLGLAVCTAPAVQTDGSFQGNCTVGGTSPANGPTDSYTSGVSKHILEYGISDLEPGVFGNSFGSPFAGGGNEDPTGVYTFLGADQTPDALQAMPHSLLFQQSFGLIANKNIGITDISTAAAAAIFAGTVTDWSKIATAAGTAVRAGTIHVCHRDLGSGTRSATDVYFEQTGCNAVGATTPLVDNLTNPDNFSTGEVLACVDADINAIGYVSIDNFSKVKASTTALTLDGRTASNLLTATGGWDYAFEASANKNKNITFTATQNTFYNYFIPAIQALATAPQSVQVNALPGVNGNHAGGGAIVTNGKDHVTNFARDTTGGGNSCTPLTAH